MEESALKQMLDALETLRQEAKQRSTRERSLAITNLEQAIMWEEKGRQLVET